MITLLSFVEGPYSDDYLNVVLGDRQELVLLVGVSTPATLRCDTPSLITLKALSVCYFHWEISIQFKCIFKF